MTRILSPPHSLKLPRPIPLIVSSPIGFLMGEMAHICSTVAGATVQTREYDSPSTGSTRAQDLDGEHAVVNCFRNAIAAPLPDTKDRKSQQ